ncbi:hypothetical protein ACP4OV_017730 [Aristida adscensionis]
MLDTGSIELELDHSKFESLAIGEFIVEDVSVGGITWKIACIASRVGAVTRPTMDNKACQITCTPDDDAGSAAGRGWHKFVERSRVETVCFVYGSITFLCGITILQDGNRISVPSSDLGSHLGHLLDCADGSDVSFSAGGETFRAHRAVLAARSPVFRAQLLGSMADARMDRINLHEIQPATFQILRKFIYTDELPTDKELDSSSETTMDLLRHLLAAADMYDVDRLKLMCAQKLWDRVSAETVAMTLGCAETYNCPELKSRCVEFFVEEKNFKKAVLTEGYLRLMQGFPSVIDEIRARVGT